MNYIIIISSFIVFTCSACSSGNNKKKIEDFEPGKLVQKVACKNDATITYSLYLPSIYSQEKKIPIIFAFDAHAKGNKPVELFQELAEKYGYIIIGSNNSQNGLSSDVTMRFYEIMLDDVLGRFSIDHNRIYTTGFSGGSRVASSIAIFKGGIAGVIGCSAGFPALSQPIQFKFDYIGYVGNEDMNYLEMVTLDDALQQSGYRHHLVVFNGTHDWPPKESLAEAFIWLEANAMKDKLKPIEKEFVQNNIKSLQDQADLAEKAGRKFEAFEIYKKIISFFDGLVDLTNQKNKLKQLESAPEVQSEIALKMENRKTELSMQTQYVKSLAEKNADWWKEEIKRLNEKADNSSKNDEQAIIKRVLGYLSLAAYSNSNGLLNANQLDQAARFIELYSIIDPTNNEHAYLAACLHVKQNDPEKAFTSLDLALTLGYKDLSRFQNDTVLARLKNDTRYYDYLQKLQQ